MSSWNGQEQINLSYILSWMCIYRTMFHTVGIAHILYFWKTLCRLAQNMVMIMMTIMGSRRRRRRYLRTVTFESVHKPPTCYCTAVFLYTVTQSTVCSGCHTAC